MITAMIILCLLALCYFLCLRGRSHHPRFTALRGWNYAHRGLHDETSPENSMAAFQKALEAGYGIELDVHLLKDGNLGIMHDSKLQRTTGRDGVIEDLTVDQLTDFTLAGTNQTIPTFQQVLDLFQGKAPMIIELKTSGKNYAQLCEKVCQVLDCYSGPYCLESFDSRCIYWLRKHRPDLIRGQLAENFFRRNNTLIFPLKVILSFQLANFITRPDFIAYRFEDRKNLGNFLCRKVWKIQGVSWTLENKEDFDIACAEGWLPIFERFRP